MSVEGKCQVCRRWIVLRKDGTLRGHGGRMPRPWCQGSLMKPADPPGARQRRGTTGGPPLDPDELESW